MHFLFPWVLWLSSLLLIPVLIHLFYFRRYKTVLFSNTTLLDNVIKQSRSQQRLRNLIILLFRILFILSLVFAFAQPVITNKNKTNSHSDKVVAIYIDNSFSMNQNGEKTSLLEESKSKAIAMVQSLSLQTRYILFYHGMEFSPSRLLSSEEVQKKINEINISPLTFKWSNVFNIFKNAQKSLLIKHPLQFAFFTDGQSYTIDYNQWEKDSSNIYLFYAKGNSTGNLCIDSLWIEQPNHMSSNAEKVQIKIINYSKDDMNNIPVRLFINDSLKSVATVNLKGENAEVVTFNYLNPNRNWLNGKVELSDFPVTFDNDFYFSYPIFSKQKVAIIGNDNRHIFQAFFDADSSLSATFFSADKFPISVLNHYQVVVVNQLKDLSSGLMTSLQNYINQGGVVILIPSIQWQIESINKLFKEFGFIFETKDTLKYELKISSYEQAFFSGLFTKKEEKAKMPWAKNSFSITSLTNCKTDVLLTYENSKNAVIRMFQGSGQLYIFGFLLDKNYSDFASHPLFVTMLHRIIQLSLPNTKLYYTISPQTQVVIRTDSLIGERGVELKHCKTKISWIPFQQHFFNEVKIMLRNNYLEDGIYDVMSDKKSIGKIALNYDRKESEMKFYNENELINFLKDKGYNVTPLLTTSSDEIKSIIQSHSQGIALWKWFIVMALMFILAEMAVIHFWKT